MKRKSLLALFMAAVMFVSSLVTDVNLVSASTADKATTGAEATSDVKWKGALTEEEKKALMNGSISADELTVIDPLGVRTGDYDIPSNVTVGSTITSNGTVITETDSHAIAVDLLNRFGAKRFEILNEKTVKDDDVVRVIIFMNDKAVLEKDSEAVLDETTQKEIEKLEDKQDTVVERIEDQVFDGEDLDITYSYTWVANGVATEVPYGMIDEIEKVRGVKEVVIQTQYETPSSKNDTYTAADSPMIGRDDSWAAGYTGQGMKIAIIDTGLDDDHQNFAPMSEDKLTEDSATRDSIAAVLESGNLKAQELKPSLTASKVDRVYFSNKIAFGFNYVDRSYRINHADNMGDHGTHVAGISAANDLRAEREDSSVGVAPDAQLYVMKVFGTNGGAYTEDIVAAVEDAMLLDADVINMSLGSPCGFSENGVINEIYKTISDHKTICVVAAGNSATAGDMNLWGTNTNLTSNPDNSVVSSPATYANVTSVASVDNIGSLGYYLEVNGFRIAYADGSNGMNAKFLDALGGQTVEYAMVDNFGQSPEDFTNADVAGKVAVVQRGLTAFTEKCQFAEEAGAIACLIYNNTSGTIGLDLTNGTAVIPCASITMQAGEFLLSQWKENPNVEMSFSATKAVVPSETAYRMSDFTSWGVAPDLKLEPDITGPGGNIYSTVDNGKYDLMSGTSMASPNVAGVTALIMQYAKKRFADMPAADLRNFVNQLMVSTAVPLDYDETVKFSPRVQGSGLANAFYAIKSNAYLTVDGADVPKAELYDDPAKTGAYEYTFTVHNFGDTPLYYSLDTTCQTEDVMNVEGFKFMSMTPIVLGANTEETCSTMFMPYDLDKDGDVDTADASELMNVDVDSIDEDLYALYDINGDDAINEDDVYAFMDALTGAIDIDLEKEFIEVAPNSDVDVTVNVNVNKSGKRFMDNNFENGIYVEGYTFLTAENAGGIDLSLPYLAFYGDWTQAPIIDAGYYWEEEDESLASQYWNVLFTNFGGDSWLPGINPYGHDEEFNPEYVSISPNGDGYGDFIDDIYLSLLRNANKITFTYENASDHTVYDEQSINKMPKSYLVTAYNMIIPFVYSSYAQTDGLKGYFFRDETGTPLANNTEVNLVIKAELDYDKHASANVADTWTTHITVDTEKPTIESAAVRDGADGKKYLDVTFHDNVAVAGMNFVSKSGRNVLAQYPVDKPATSGASVTQSFDITGFGNDFYMVPGDYAFNETFYEVVTTENHPDVDEDYLYGFRVYNSSYGSSALGWVAIDPETGAIAAIDSELDQNAITAAASVGDYMIVVDAAHNMFAVRPGYWDDRLFIKNLQVDIAELTFDQITETLYGFDRTNGYLVSINIATGEVKQISKNPIGVHLMAVDNRGVLYAIDDDCQLRTINKKTGAWDKTIADLYEYTGINPYYSQSMTFDNETKTFYWAASSMSWMGASGSLYAFSLKSGSTTPSLASFEKVADFEDADEIVGLVKLNDSYYELPTDEAISAIELDREKVTMLADDEEQLYIAQTPWYAEAPTYNWESSNTSVATVDADGVITSVATGTTVITVTSTDDPSVTASCTVNVIDPASTLGAFANIGSTVNNQWVTFDTSDMSTFTKDTTEEGTVAFTAAEYYDGYLYAYSQAAELYRVDPSNGFAQTKLGERHTGNMIVDMAFNYADGFMYGILQESSGMTHLVQIDLLTGEYNIVYNTLLDEEWSAACTLAITTEGKIYISTISGYIYTVDVEGYALEPVGYCGFPASMYTQSMAYDHDQDILYWSIITATGATAVGYVDQETGAIVALGAVDNGVQLTGMYCIPTVAPAVPAVDVTSVELAAALDNGTLLVLDGTNRNIPVNVLPFNANDRSIVWTSDDTDVADIDGNLIVGKKPGVAHITGTKTSGLDADAYVANLEFDVKVIPASGDMTGYVVTDFYSGASSFWGAFSDDNIEQGEGIADASGYDVFAGTYYNGLLYTYGQDTTNDMDYVYQYMVIDPDQEYTVVEKNVLDNAPDMRDLSYDYTEGAMYAVGGVRNVGGSTSLYTIDMATGEYYLLGKICVEGLDWFTGETVKQDLEIAAMTFVADGTLYGVDVNGDVYQIDKTNGTATYVMSTGYENNAFQSMYYDYNTGNIYWAQAYANMFAGAVSASLLEIDLETQSVLNVGCVGNAGCSISALHIIEKAPIEEHVAEPTNVILGTNGKVLSAGDSFTLVAKPYPLCAASTVEIAYASSDNSVATVNADGVVTAVKAGKATITVTAGTATATCVVKVVGTNVDIYAVNSTGIESTGLYKPETIKTSSSIAGLNVYTSAYHGKENVFYAYDEAGYLWKFNRDGSGVKKVSASVYMDLIDNADEWMETDWSPVKLLDLAYNPYDGNLYAVLDGLSAEGVMDDWGYENHDVIDVFYKVDPKTGALTKAGQITTGDASGIGRADKIAFYGEKDVYVYDGYEDYVSKCNIETGVGSRVVWAQAYLVGGDRVGFAYNEELNMIYLATYDTFYNMAMVMYQVDPELKKMEKIGEAAFDETMSDLAFLPGKPEGKFSDTATNLVYNVVLDKNGNPQATVTGVVDKTKTTIKIPDTVRLNGYSCNVVAIADNALKGNTKVATVTVGKNVTKIGANAFYGCTGLTTVTLGANVASIGASAFQGCTRLTKIALGSKITAVASKTFYGCTALTTVTLSANTTSIGTYAFYNCAKLTKITLGNKVKTIGDKAFYGCKAMTAVTFGTAVTTIGVSAFQGCAKLAKITLGNAVTTIKEKAFYGCTGLKTATIGTGLKTVGANVFYGNTALTTLTIKSTKLASAGLNAKAFAGITTKTTVKVPSAKVSAYKSLFQKKGLNKKVKVVKY